jgi:hypothetical protein
VTDEPFAESPNSAEPAAIVEPGAIADDEARYPVRIQDLPSGERPRERLFHAGPSALSNAELLAILLRTGTAGESALDISRRLLATHGLDGLQRLDADLLAREHDLGPASAAWRRCSPSNDLASVAPKMSARSWARRWPRSNKKNSTSCSSTPKAKSNPCGRCIAAP